MVTTYLEALKKLGVVISYKEDKDWVYAKAITQSDKDGGFTFHIDELPAFIRGRMNMLRMIGAYKMTEGIGYFNEFEDEYIIFTNNDEYIEFCKLTLGKCSHEKAN
jgi:hypothetical protein